MKDTRVRYYARITVKFERKKTVSSCFTYHFSGLINPEELSLKTQFKILYEEYLKRFPGATISIVCIHRETYQEEFFEYYLFQEAITKVLGEPIS